jgi:hypothetical protein
MGSFCLLVITAQTRFSLMKRGGCRRVIPKLSFWYFILGNVKLETVKQTKFAHWKNLKPRLGRAEILSLNLLHNFRKQGFRKCQLLFWP